jgi:cupin fold WbuC family metalloprotein
MLQNRLDENLIADLLRKAHASPRRRANHCFHRPGERVQKMVNAALAGSYFAPHRHQDPDKAEIFTILRGRVMVLSFDDGGEISDRALLESGGNRHQVEIPARVWHALVVLSAEAVLYEVIDGEFDPATHKRFAPWAPAEGNPERTGPYLESLVRRCGADGNQGLGVRG